MIELLAALHIRFAIRNVNIATWPVKPSSIQSLFYVKSGAKMDKQQKLNWKYKQDTVKNWTEIWKRITEYDLSAENETVIPLYSTYDDLFLKCLHFWPNYYYMFFFSILDFSTNFKPRCALRSAVQWTFDSQTVINCQSWECSNHDFKWHNLQTGWI